MDERTRLQKFRHRVDQLQKQQWVLVDESENPLQATLEYHQVFYRRRVISIGDKGELHEEETTIP